MPRKQFNDGQEIVFSDLASISSVLEKELFERVLYQMMNRQDNVVFGDSFAVGFVDATHVSVNAGVGFQTDNTQVDPEPTKRMMFLSALQNLVIAAADPANPRIDIVCIQNQRANGATTPRNFKDPVSGVVSAQNMVVETDWLAGLQVVAGVPAGSPAAPAVPAGWIKLAQVTVAAVTGVAGAGSITDTRPMYQRPSSSLNRRTAIASGTVGSDDEFIYIDATAGSVTETLPSAASCSGKVYVIKRKVSDVSANNAVVAAAGTDLIDGQATYALAAGQTLEIMSDGTGWAIL